MSGEDVTRVIGTDPALSVHILRVANSAFYHGEFPVKDLGGAIVRLGNKAVEHIVTMLAVAELFNAKAKPSLGSYLSELWHHLIAYKGKLV